MMHKTVNASTETTMAAATRVVMIAVVTRACVGIKMQINEVAAEALATRRDSAEQAPLYEKQGFTDYDN